MVLLPSKSRAQPVFLGKILGRTRPHDQPLLPSLHVLVVVLLLLVLPDVDRLYTLPLLFMLIMNLLLLLDRLSGLILFLLNLLMTGLLFLIPFQNLTFPLLNLFFLLLLPILGLPTTNLS